jgi:Phospholipase/Carboxylesterase
MLRLSFVDLFSAGVISLAISTSAVSAQIGTVSADVPDEIDAQADYLIYLHGQIIELQGRRPTHPTFGVYEYDAILEDFARRGFQVISEARPPGTGIADYAEKVADQIRTLVGAGVSPERIAVVGFSKGAMITIATSSSLRMPRLRYVILAGCNAGVFGNTRLTLTGRVLSIYEASDDIGLSCAPLFDRSPDAEETVERLIDTGARHGAFYLLRDAWVEPLFAWLDSGASTEGHHP